MNLYILDGHTPVKVNDVLEWGQWFETADRIVKRTMVGTKRISTAFLGIDHGYGDTVLLFETMVFDRTKRGMKKWSEIEGYTERYTTWGEAERGHEAIVERIKRETR